MISINYVINSISIHYTIGYNFFGLNYDLIIELMNVKGVIQ